MKYSLVILAIVSSLIACRTTEVTVEKNVTVNDTTYTETIKADTTFNAIKDTVILEKEKLTIKYIRLRDSVYLSGQCEGDTIYKTIKVPVYHTIKCPELTRIEMAYK
ncbi:MAG: hypothetical protein ACK566_06270, partial [Bacteroidota bacterium]